MRNPRVATPGLSKGPMLAHRRATVGTACSGTAPVNQPNVSCVRRPSPPNGDNDFACMRRVYAAQLDPGAKIVLLVVLDHARYGKSKCIASNATIAAESNLSPRMASLHVKALVDAGWLTLERLGPTANHGRVLHPGPLLSIADPAQPIAHPPSVTGCAPPAQWVADPLRNGLQTNDSSKDQKKDVAAVRPPDGRPSAPGELDPQTIPEGISVVGGRTLAEMIGLSPDRRAQLDEESRRAGWLRPRPA